MHVDKVKKQLEEHSLLPAYKEFATSSATVELAALAAGCAPERIAKSLCFNTSQGPIIIVAVGTSRVNSSKFKKIFGEKPRFPQAEDVHNLTGHPVGGVCPFALPEGVRVYLDVLLQNYDTIYPAAGASNNAVELSPTQLASVTQGTWIDVCKAAEA